MAKVISSIGNTSINRTSELINDGENSTSRFVEESELGEFIPDIISNILTDTSTIDFTYNDIANTITADVKPNSITATHLADNINVSEFVNDIGYELTSNKGLPNGYASLDGGGKVPVSQLPNSIMEYKGVYNAATNTPTLIDGIGNTGDVYRTTVAGAGVNGLNFVVGDYVTYNGTVWEKAHSGADNVSSVFGRLGAVVSQNGDYTASQITNIPFGNISSTTVQAALNELDTEKANDLNVVHISGNETISGVKTFSNNITAPSYNGYVPLDKANTEGARLDSTFTSIYAWGDSLTEGAGSSPWKPYPEVLSDITKFSVTNKGVGGETSTQIKNRLVADTGNYSKSVLIWAGRNNYTSPTTVKADIAAMVSTIGHSRYLILGILNSSSEVLNGTEWTTITTLNNDLKNLYGDKYVNIREYLVSQYNPSIPQDVTDHNNDVPPSSLRSDPIHLNNAGYVKVANYVNQKLGVLFNQTAYFQSKDFKYYFENNLPMHTVGDENFTGVKTAINTGTTLVNGLSFINNGTGITSCSTNYVNNNTGRAIRITNVLGGTGVNLDNQGTGIGFFISNTSTGRGFSFNNTNTGTGLFGINTGTGIGIFSDNQSTGTGISSQNGGTGVGVNVFNASSGIGYRINNNSTGTGIVLNSTTPSTGDLIQFTKNFVLTTKIDQNGVISTPPPIISTIPTTSAGTYDILTRNTSTGVVEKVASSTIATIASPSFTGTPTAPTAATGTNTTQIATTAFVQAIKPYTNYVAKIQQTSTSDPTASVRENTLSGAIVWTRSGVGTYVGTLSGAFPSDAKTVFYFSKNTPPNYDVQIGWTSTNTVEITTRNASGTLVDGAMGSFNSLEIRVYP